MLVERYLVPVRFHVYDALSDLLALGAAPNISQSSSFALASALGGMSCGVKYYVDVPMRDDAVGHKQSSGTPPLEMALQHAGPKLIAQCLEDLT
jgi:hypothetical protein